MPKYPIPAALICLWLGACSTDKPLPKITVTPSAVIAADVYVRDASAAYEAVSLGGAALRSGEFAHTLNQKKAVDTEQLRAACRSSAAPETCKALSQQAVVKQPKKAVGAEGTASNIYSDALGGKTIDE